jgi:hypothetical protein
MADQNPPRRKKLDFIRLLTALEDEEHIPDFTLPSPITDSEKPLTKASNPVTSSRIRKSIPKKLNALDAQCQDAELLSLETVGSAIRNFAASIG